MQAGSPRNHASIASDLARRFANPAIYVVGFIPAVWTFYLAVSDQLGADPLKVLERSLGLWALRFLIIGLAITPLRRLGGPNLVRYRRAFGLLAFFYALFHVTVYVWLDQGLDLAAIWKDIVKRPYITIGLLAFSILVPLAATSSNAMIKRLGPLWQKLHRWVYLAAAAAALHLSMLVKTWTTQTVVYVGLVAALLAFRVVVQKRRKTASGAQPVWRKTFATTTSAGKS